MESNSTKIIAWWGAILASIVFLWDVFKWLTSGPKIRLTIQTNMQTINNPLFDGEKIIFAEVVNTGPPTTITNLSFSWYPDLLSKIKRRPQKAFVSHNPSPAQPLPFLLAQGVLWQGMTTQDSAIEELASNGRLYCYLYCSHRKKPIERRVIIHSRQHHR
jgi:hypothetical protein